MKRVTQQLLPSPRGWPRHSRWRSRTGSPRQHHSWWPRWWDTRSPASAARCTHTERDANTREIKHSPAAWDACGINTHLTAERSRHQLQVSSLQIRHSERKQDFIILVSYRQETDTLQTTYQLRWALDRKRKTSTNTYHYEIKTTCFGWKKESQFSIRWMINIPSLIYSQKTLMSQFCSVNDKQTVCVWRTALLVSCDHNQMALMNQFSL